MNYNIGCCFLNIEIFCNWPNVRAEIALIDKVILKENEELKLIP